MRFPTFALSLCALAIASCGNAQSGDSAAKTTAAADSPFNVTALGTFDEAWAISIEPGTGNIFITEKGGTMKFVQPANGRLGTVTGMPQVAYGGQGGLADFIFAPDYAKSHTIYLSWAEAGEGGNKGGAVGRGTLVCEEHDSCRIDGLKVIWRQQPKVPGVLQYALRMTFSPDGKYLFVSSGDRVAIDYVQKTDNNLGKIVRLLPDGRPAPGNPFAGKGGPTDEIWTIGHRNPLGLQFDPHGQLWDLEHGPAGGDEINRLVAGDNYGWPVVSGGDNYNGTPIPRHSTHPEFHAPAINWTPVIAPGGFIFYSGKLWPEWKGQAIVAGMKTECLARVSLTGDHGTEVARYDMGHRIRGLAEAADGSLYVIEDGKGGRLLHLTPK
uniref:PQQ-dependent sugar dehydrogenase n=1 Tax=Altererythrobacter segetis TaxID=1104773 RepID=UPI00311AAD7B